MFNKVKYPYSVTFAPHNYSIRVMAENEREAVDIAYALYYENEDIFPEMVESVASVVRVVECVA